MRSAQTRALFKEAEAHYLKATTLDKDGNILGGSSYADLGQTYSFILTHQLTDVPKKDGNDAISAFSKGAEIYQKRGNLPQYARLLVKKGNVLFNLSKLEDSQAATTKDLNDAESAVLAALRNIEEKSENYAEAQNLLGVLYAERRDYQKAIDAHETAIRSVQSQDYLPETLTLLGQAQTSYAWQTGDKTLYEKGMENFRRASQICQSIPFDCYEAHISSGTASFNWADRLRAGSPDWTMEIERSITEFGLSSSFLSRGEQATLYAETKQLTARANTERGLTEKGEESLRFLRAALLALTDGIDTLTSAGFDAKRLYEKRAQCYDRLRADSIDQAKKNEYLRLATQDRDAAKRLAPKVASAR